MHAVAARGIPANRSIHLRFSQDLRSFAASPFATSAGRIDHQARNEVTCSKSRGTGSARAAAFLLFVVAGVAATAQAQTDERRTLTARQIEALGIRIQTVDGAQAASFARYPAQVVVPVARQRLVAAPLPGLVESLQVAVGDPVRAGQTLAVLRSAQASELQRDVAQATSQVDLARRSLERDEQLFAEGLIAQSRLDAARAQARQAQAQQIERRRALEQAGVSAGSGQIVLRAPIAGVVLEQHAVLGQRVEQAAPLYRIATLDRLWVEMQAPATDAAALAPGRAVRVEASPAAGRDGAARDAREIEGRVIALGQSVDEATQTVLVRAEVRASNGILRPGQTVVATVEMPGAGTVRLPAMAVVEEGGATVVFVQEAAGSFVRVPVGVVHSADSVVTVSGIAAGAQVVVHGTAALKAVFAAPPAAQ